MSKQSTEEKETNSFWHINKLEELVKQQGVEPISNLDSISSKWPVDDDPESLLSFILQERNSLRNLAAK